MLWALRDGFGHFRTFWNAPGHYLRCVFDGNLLRSIPQERIWTLDVLLLHCLLVLLLLLVLRLPFPRFQNQYQGQDMEVDEKLVVVVT